MQISSTSGAGYLAQIQATQQPDQARVQATQASTYDGPDAENDGDADDGGSVTATRGQNLNITA